jgi:hypothetical protein
VIPSPLCIPPSIPHRHHEPRPVADTDTDDARYSTFRIVAISMVTQGVSECLSNIDPPASSLADERVMCCRAPPASRALRVPSPSVVSVPFVVALAFSQRAQPPPCNRGERLWLTRPLPFPLLRGQLTYLVPTMEKPASPSRSSPTCSRRMSTSRVSSSERRPFPPVSLRQLISSAIMMCRSSQL